MIKKAEDFISAIETARSSRIDIIRAIAVEEAVMYLLNIRADHELGDLEPLGETPTDLHEQHQLAEMAEAEGPCPVCKDIGGYPVHNEMGKQLYMIPCPECGKQYDPDGHLRVEEEMLAGAEEATSNAVDPDEDHTVSLGDAADAVVKTSMQRACEGAGWMLVDSNQDTFSFMNEDGQGYLVKRWANTNEREAWADLYDFVQKENGVVPHTTALEAQAKEMDIIQTQRDAYLQKGLAQAKEIAELRAANAQLQTDLHFCNCAEGGRAAKEIAELRAALAAAREQCAKVAENAHNLVFSQPTPSEGFVAAKAAAMQPDDADLMRVAKALAFQGFGTPWDTIGATSRDFYLNLARVALENYEAFK